MSRNTKIALGIIGGLVALCVIVGVAVVIIVGTMGKSIMGNMMVTDPTEVAKVAGQIAEYDLPPGYHEQMVMNIAFEKMLLITPDTSSTEPTIMILSISSSMMSGGKVDQEQLRQQMQQNMQNQSSYSSASLQLVDTSDVEIADQTVTLVTYEGQSSTGSMMRQVTSSFFEVKDNYLMLMIMGPVGQWPEDDINAFITSIH
jgi:hypothetical protein